MHTNSAERKTLSLKRPHKPQMNKELNPTPPIGHQVEKQVSRTKRDPRGKTVALRTPPKALVSTWLWMASESPEPFLRRKAERLIFLNFNSILEAKNFVR